MERQFHTFFNLDGDEFYVEAFRIVAISKATKRNGPVRSVLTLEGGSKVWVEENPDEIIRALGGVMLSPIRPKL